MLGPLFCAARLALLDLTRHGWHNRNGKHAANTFRRELSNRLYVQALKSNRRRTSSDQNRERQMDENLPLKPSPNRHRTATRPTIRLVNARFAGQGRVSCILLRFGGRIARSHSSSTSGEMAGQARMHDEDVMNPCVRRN